MNYANRQLNGELFFVVAVNIVDVNTTFVQTSTSGRHVNPYLLKLHSSRSERRCQ